MSHSAATLSADDALQRLLDGNRKYREGLGERGDISPQIRERTVREGQHPFAVVIACSDSRVIPEALFRCGIGDLFVIRLAGNVIDVHQLGSIEYAADHLGCRLVMVLGHTHCGAVDAAIHHDPDGYVRFVTDQIKFAIRDETDSFRASCLNVRHSMRLIEKSLGIRKMEDEDGLRVVGAVYDIEDGHVEMLD